MLASCRDAVGFAALCLAIATEAVGEDAYAIERIERARKFTDDPQAVLIFARFRWADRDQLLVASVREQDCALNLPSRLGAIGLERTGLASGEEWQWGGMRPNDRLFTEVCRSGTRARCSTNGCDIPRRTSGPRDL